MIAPIKKRAERLRVVGLFAGIGGIELGLRRAGHETVLFCEIEPNARAVLADQFPGVPIHADIATLPRLPPCEVVTAGFPCQDLSQAGKTAGITGSRSGLVDHVFRLLGGATSPPRWVLLENVSFMLRLDKGRAMTHVTSELERLGYRWAYRVVDTRAFGIPQRRQRVLILASRSEDPRGPLLEQDVGAPEDRVRTRRSACGFYWTEGLKGLGWAVDAVPTLKGGSSIGIASPPAVWLPDGRIVTPHIRDAERLQGFPAGWTGRVTSIPSRRATGVRWKLVGNAVTVKLAEWIGRRLESGASYDDSGDSPLSWGAPWPNAAWSMTSTAHSTTRSMWPVRRPFRPLAEFLVNPVRLLSQRAATGFLGRTERASLRFDPEFLAAVREQARQPAASDSAP